MKWVRAEFVRGMRDNLPFMPSSIAFGLVAGAVSVQAGLSEFQSSVLCIAMFAGNAQLVSMQLWSGGAPAFIVILGSFVVNLRHVMYGLSLAPHVREISVRWKALMAYIMVDNVYALSLQRFQREDARVLSDGAKLSYYLGCALLGYSMWSLACISGAYLGARLPASWQFDLIPSIGMLALIVPNLKDRATVIAATVSATISIALYSLPLRSGVLVAGAIAMLIGLWLENRAQRGGAVRS